MVFLVVTTQFLLGCLDAFVSQAIFSLFFGDDNVASGENAVVLGSADSTASSTRSAVLATVYQLQTVLVQLL